MKMTKLLTNRSPSIKNSYNTQKQPRKGVLRKSCSENMQQIYRRTPIRSVISIKLESNTFSQKLLWAALSGVYSPCNILFVLKRHFGSRTAT